METMDKIKAATLSPAPDNVAANATQPPLKLNIKQQRLMDALVGNPDIKAACRATGVARATAFRWLREPGFREELAQQRNAVLDETMDGIKAHAILAMTELAGLLQSKDDRLRRMTCNDILSHAMKVRTIEDVDQRLKALEKAVKDFNRKGMMNSNPGHPQE